MRKAWFLIKIYIVTRAVFTIDKRTGGKKAPYVVKEINLSIYLINFAKKDTKNKVKNFFENELNEWLYILSGQQW